MYAVILKGELMQIKPIIENIFSVKNETVNNKKFKVLRLCGLKVKHKIMNLNNKNILFDNSIEKENLTLYKHQYEKYWLDFSKEELPKDLKEKYFALIKNLDAESIEVIDRIIYRFNLIKNNLNKKTIDLFTEKEKEEILKQYDNFDSKIIMLAPNIWKHGKYLLPLKCGGEAFYFKHGIDKLSEKSIDLIKNNDIIDAGAFVGDSACIFSEITQNGVKIHAFEPVNENYNMLLKTIQMNNLQNVIPVKYAVGNKTETVHINVHDSGSTILESNREGMQKEEINIITLDEYVKNNNLNIGLIKTDVEGFEPQLLEGAKETICTQRPVLLISIYHNMYDLFEIKPMIESWNLGYKFKIIKCHNTKFLHETMLIAEHNE